jgi:hypothetical protein
MTNDMTQRLLAKSFKTTSMLAEKISDYNRTLELRWIPNAKRTDPEDELRPYVIVQRLPHGGENMVMYLSEAEVANPPAVLARLYGSDNSKHPSGAILRRIENQERAQREWQARVAEEEQAEALDFWRSVWNSPKHTFKHNGVKMDV